MNQNWIAIHAICKELNSFLASSTFVTAYSNGVEELVLVFELEDSHFAIKCLFLEGAMYLVFLKDVPNPGSKALYWFKNANGEKIKGFKPNGLDRSFRLELSSGKVILFKMYGRMSNVLFYQEKARPMEIFRTIHKNDLELKLSQFPKEMGFNMTFNNKYDFATNNKHLPVSIIELTFESYNRGSLEAHIKEQINEMSGSWGIVPIKLGYGLSVLETTHDSVLDACNELVKQHFPVYVFAKEKEKLLQSKKRQYNQIEKQIIALQANREKVVNRKSSKEIADILMANMHQIEKGITEVELYDFYEDKNIKIKLNKNLSPQANAEKFYKKSKSGGKELEEIDRKLQDFTKKNEKLLVELEELEQMEDFKTMKTLSKKGPIKEEKVQVSSPYWTFLVEGLEVLVGKNAKANDELLHLTKKNDWWFHAKDVAGSHCVVRNGGALLSPTQLEKVGALAAYYSKAKSQTVVPVIYTPRKFVRKPKGFLPGKVIVEKESVVLVEPARPNNS